MKNRIMITALVSLTFTTNSLYASETPTNLKTKKAAKQERPLLLVTNDFSKNKKKSLFERIFDRKEDNKEKKIRPKQKSNKEDAIKSNTTNSEIIKTNNIPEKNSEIEIHKNTESSPKLIPNTTEASPQEEIKPSQKNNTPEITDRAETPEKIIEITESSKSEVSFIKESLEEISNKKNKIAKISNLKNLQGEVNTNSQISKSDKKKFLRKIKQEIKFTKKDIVDDKIRNMNCKNKKTKKDIRNCKKEARNSVKSL